MKQLKLYEMFLGTEFDNIQTSFAGIGKSVSTLEEVSTYKGWEDKGRKVYRGEKGLSIESEGTFPQIMFRNGHPILDKEGKKVIRKLPKKYNFFHIDQTRTTEEYDLN